MHECLKARGTGPGCSECRIMRRGFCSELVAVLQKMAGHLKGHWRETIPAGDRTDVLAGTVEGVFNGIDRFEGRKEARFSTWAWSIYRNKTTDYFRQMRKHHPKSFRLTEESFSYLSPRIPKEILTRLEVLTGHEYRTQREFLSAIEEAIGKDHAQQFRDAIVESAQEHPAPEEPSETNFQADNKWTAEEVIAVLTKWLADDHSGCAHLYLDLYEFLKLGKTQKELAAAHGVTTDSMKKRIERCRKSIRRILEGEG